jgi:hypothetical protein
MSYNTYEYWAGKKHWRNKNSIYYKEYQKQKINGFTSLYKCQYSSRVITFIWMAQA